VRRGLWPVAALLALCAAASGTVFARQVKPSKADLEQELRTLEASVASDPENLELAADYRMRTIASAQFDRSIDFLRPLAKRRDSGPYVQISLALALADKVPTSGDIRRLYLGRDAMNALTVSIAKHPTVLAYYFRGQINLYYNRLIFHRTDKGVADLTQALSMVTPATPPLLVALTYTALGDGYFRLDDLARARKVWAEGLAKCPDDEGLKTRLGQEGQPLLETVTKALSAGRRSDTSLKGMLP
jgi:hypothetical protein